MRKVAIIILFVALGSKAFCADWTTSEKALYVSACAAMTFDLYTTERFLDKGCTETNKILGKSPSDLALVGYGAAWAVGLFFLADGLPDYRKWILGAFALVEIKSGLHNYRECKLTWHF